MIRSAALLLSSILFWSRNTSAFKVPGPKGPQHPPSLQVTATEEIKPCAGIGIAGMGCNTEGQEQVSVIPPMVGSTELCLTTFNLLAPCYKRLGGSKGLLSRTPRESEFDGVWSQRVTGTADFIASYLETSDLICLQEFWCQSEEYQSVMRNRLQAKYDFHLLKRPGKKQDGIAVLCRKGRFAVLSSQGARLSDHGDRVALMLHLQEQGGKGQELLLANTHLSFPHNAIDRSKQMAQIQRLTQGLEDFATKCSPLPHPDAPRIIVGDLNVEENDPVCLHLSESGYRNAYRTHYRDGRRAVSHLTHRGEALMVDHVFYKSSTKGSLGVKHAALIPAGEEETTWNDRFDLSDHRPLTVQLDLSASAKNA
ncbi:unnamed protein product [Chrysoparadoxa australica]